MNRLHGLAPIAIAGAIAGLGTGTTAFAQVIEPNWLASDVAGKPVPGGMNFQAPVTPVMHDLVWLDTFMHVILAAVCLLVVVLLAIVIVRFNRRSNPKAATFTHHPLLEVAWTALPVVILIVIAIPSLKLLFFELNVPPDPDVTIKATGAQWYWTYEYPDEGIDFASVMLERDELEQYGYEPDEYLLATDTRVVVPVDAVVHVLVTASDVIHAWTIPSFGSKIDAMPGRINETWFKATVPGVYFGQCSELCGLNHSYMPIVVQVVEQEDYDTWVLEQQALNGTGAATRVAAAK